MQKTLEEKISYSAKTTFSTFNSLADEIRLNAGLPNSPKMLNKGQIYKESLPKYVKQPSVLKNVHSFSSISQT